jgi:phosphatidylserine decarboxylase
MKSALWKESRTLCIILFLFALLLWFLIPKRYHMYLILFFTLLFLFLWFFYRYPSLPLSFPNNVFLSPTDGTVLDIQYDAVNKQYRFIIFLHLFNQHHQFVPVDGIVQKVLYKPGTFHPANFFEKSQYNERCTTIIQPTKMMYGPIHITQYAGQIARRIVNRLEPGMPVKQGSYVGMIKLSSRVDIDVSETDMGRLLVKKGSKVRALSTPLFAYRT